MLVYGKYACFVMQMYACVLCAYCDSTQCCITCSLLMLVEDASGDQMRPTEGACSIALPAMNTRPRTSAL